MATARTLSRASSDTRSDRRQIWWDSLVAADTDDYEWEIDVPPEFDSVDIEIQMDGSNANAITITPYISKETDDSGGPTHSVVVGDCPWNRSLGMVEALKIESTGNDDAFRLFVRFQKEQ